MTVDRVLTRLFGPAQAHVAPGAFLLALLLTPVAFAASGIVFMLVGAMFTTVAAVLGLPAYATAGTLALYVVVTRHVDADGLPGFRASAVAGLIANIASGPIAFAVLTVASETPGQVLHLAKQYALLGFAAAPIQTIIFVALYRTFATARPVMRDAHVFS